MTDRELLVAAAKAAGYNVSANHYGVLLRYKNEQGLEFCAWNPITNDGDALRLAVKLGIRVYLDDKHVGAEYHNARAEVLGFPLVVESMRLDPYAATRRAIVRAAAAMAVQGASDD